MQPDELADIVVMTVKAALAPVQERLAVAERTCQDLQAKVDGTLALRDRLVVMETKAESFAAVPSVPGPIGPQGLPGADGKDAVIDVTDLVARLLPLIPAAKDGRDGIDGKDGLPGRDGRDGLPGIGEKGRDGLDGKEGPAGKDGRDGLNGKDGAPGLSFEGVYQDGKTYQAGQLATYGGSSWHCNQETTSKPGDGSKDWTLMVKRGRDGRDGRDAVDPVPVVSVGRH